MLIVGRFIVGFCGGLFCVAAPMYIAEISDTKIRGLLSSFFELLICVGILFSYVIGAFVPVFWFSIVCAVIPVLFAACFFWMPETPQYLLRSEKVDEARKSLQWFRGPYCDIKNELEDMKNDGEEEKKNKISFIAMFRDRLALKGILIVFGVFFMQQLCGYSAVLFYANSIFESAGSTLDPNINSIIVAAVQVAATIPASLVVDRLGRKVLLLISAVAMGILIVILGFYFFYQVQLVSQGWLPVTLLVLYVIFYSFGAGPVAWVVTAEIFAPQVKGPASAIGATSNWLLAFLVTLFYADMVAALNNNTTFWIFGGCCFLGAAFILFALPETKGKTTAQILKELRGKDPVGQNANLPLHALACIKMDKGEVSANTNGSTKTQYIAALAATLGAMALGTVLGWSSPAQTPILTGEVFSFTVSTSEFSWVGSVVNLGAAVSCLPTGFLVDWIGRKYTMLFISIPFVIGWAFIIWPAAVEMLIVGRFIAGFCGGLFCVASPMYIAEISDTKIRGLLSSFFQLLVVIGILFSYIIGAFVPVFWLSLICAIVPIAFAACFFWMPETPQYLLRRGKVDEATKSLQWFRGAHCDIKNELEDMKNAEEQERNNKISFFAMFGDRLALKGILILFGVFFLQQLSGINAVLFYANSIFESAGSTLDPNINSIIIGAVQVAATVPASLVVDRLGRKLLLLVSAVAMGVFIVILGFYFFYQNELVEQGWLPVTLLVLYIIFFSFGAGPVVWVVAAEIFAPQVKGPASAIGATSNWLLAFLVTLFYADMVAALNNYTTFWIFGGCCFLGAAFVLFVLPETKGKTNEQILKELGAKD
ncbi:facilitated trehalose transporter Tret1-2 homolog [Cloeon dipterum]|uniref:facilitated trehalose transporter Tret1-2 homolog n=1 Tax=Cloeon dipterum TaxID=197152 RepID=UPI003220811E